MRRSILSGDEESTGVDMTPLIDMMFNLLLFYIVTTTFIEDTGVRVDKPQAVTAVQLERNSIVLAVTAQGQVVYGGREIGVSGVRAMVHRLVQREALPVIIEVDEKAGAGIVVRVIDEAKLGGAKVVSLAADVQPGGN
jgi:biopolymer transport protein ExbD